MVQLSVNNHSSAHEFTQTLARSNNMDSFFVADLGKIHSLVSQWTTNLPKVRPFYALNCNSDEMLLRILASFPEIGFYCMTRQNLEIASDFVSSDRLFYSNPCWTRGALAQVSDNELLGFDSERDLTRMAASDIKNK